MNPGRGRRGRPYEELPREEFINQLKNLVRNLKEYKGSLIVTIILSIVGTIFTILGPNQLTKITDSIAEGILLGIDLKYIGKISLILLLLYVFSFIFSYIKDYIMAIITQKYTKNLRTELDNKLNKVPLKYFDSHQTGDILSIISNDVDNISQSLNQSIGSLTSAITTLIGVVIMMFITNFWMTITAISASLIGAGFMVFIMSKSHKYFVAHQQELGKLNAHIEEIYTFHNVVKTYNGDVEAKEKFDKYNETLFKTSFKSQFLSGMMPLIMNFVGNLGYVSISVVGAYLVMNNHITIGVIVAYMLYVRLFQGPLASIAQGMHSLQHLGASSKRVEEFLAEDEMSDESKKNTKLTKTKGNIKFNNVVFGYNKNKVVIRNFTTDIKPGSKIAIVGPTGAGKTTIVNLLMRFYEIDEGEILIDDINIKDLTRENVQNLFGMVLQDTWIFEGTVMDNIIYNNDQKPKEEVCKITKSIGLDHVIRSLPKGYETILTDAEVLSSGEKQLLTIARAMLDNAPFLILDEATSNVDVRTEKMVQKAMDKLMEGKTSFVIAHRLSTIKNADLILVLKDGNIVEQGNHNKLLKADGYYAELYNSQFEN